jgi:hypothetical protein
MKSAEDTPRYIKLFFLCNNETAIVPSNMFYMLYLLIKNDSFVPNTEMEFMKVQFPWVFFWDRDVYPRSWIRIFSILVPGPNFLHPGFASKNWSILTQKIVPKHSEIWFGLFILDPDPDFLPDYVNKAKPHLLSAVAVEICRSPRKPRGGGGRGVISACGGDWE